LDDIGPEQPRSARKVPTEHRQIGVEAAIAVESQLYPPRNIAKFLEPALAAIGKDVVDEIVTALVETRNAQCKAAANISADTCLGINCIKPRKANPGEITISCIGLIPTSAGSDSRH